MSSHAPKKARPDAAEAETARTREAATTAAPRPRFTLTWGGRRLELGERTALMGIVNVTPDSFSDGGRFLDAKRAVDHCLRLVDEGADLLDVGGESTRPGAPVVPADEECRRVLPVIEAVAACTDIPISVDTGKPEVARAALEAGAALVNDVSAGANPALLALAAERGVPVVLMHMQGTPRTMQLDPHYTDVIAEVAAFLEARCTAAIAAGVAPERLIVDPGIGFGKTVEHNFEIIARLPELHVLGRPLLLGPSRKSFIGKTLDLDVGERLLGTAAVVAACVLGGAHIVRVHDVAEMRQVCAIADAVRAGCGGGGHA
ncbi:MAG: dihydropteroate synthase [Verrucomicrobia bacterium]|nr:dihydropteroate synthase [Verrucomicrobiota bacterium]